MIDGSAAPEGYAGFLRARWPHRSILLGAYASLGNLVFLAFDLALAGALPQPRSPGQLALLRLPWIALPVAGALVARWRPDSRALPGLVMALSVAFTWGHFATYLALGLGGSAVQAAVAILCTITAATFMPLTLRGRAGVFALMAAGQVVLDLCWPQARTAGARLSTDAVILCVVACETVVFENFARSQRRGLALRQDLERTVAALEVSERYATDAARAVGSLATRIAQEANRPLAAVAQNLGRLGGPGGAPQGIESTRVRDETLEAVACIGRLVDDLRHQTDAFAIGHGGPPRHSDLAAGPVAVPGATSPEERHGAPRPRSAAGEREKTPSPAATGEVRGSYVRQWLAALHALDATALGAVRQALQPATRARIDGATRVEWVSVGILVELVHALERERGAAAVRRVARDAFVAAASAPLLRPIVDGGTRIFGATPRGLARVTPTVWQALYRGCGTFRVASHGATEAVLVHAGAPAEMDVPAFGEAVAGGLEAILTLCSQEGRATVEQSRAAANEACYTLRWGGG